jgi:hypothetical protein
LKAGLSTDQLALEYKFLYQYSIITEWLKPVGFLGSAVDDLCAFPRTVRREAGYQLTNRADVDLAAKFVDMALWSSLPATKPTAEDALAITESLRVEGNLDARRLAERLGAIVPCRSLITACSLIRPCGRI